MYCTARVFRLWCFFPLLVLLSLLRSAAAADADWGPAELLAKLRLVKSVSANFLERKYLSVLTQPLEISGTLSYTAPDRLEKITTAPFRETFLLYGQTVTGVQSNGRRYSMALSDHREIASLIEGMRATLAGDLPTLTRYYRIGLSGDRANWHLNLVPKDPRALAKISRLLLSGTGAQVHTVELFETDGDRSEMVVSAALR